MSTDHTRGPLRQSADGYSILANLGRWQTVVAEVDDSQIEADEAVENARRLVACWNACKDITTAGLEEIASNDLTRELALSASLSLRAVWLRKQEKARLAELETLEGVEKFMECEKAKPADEEDTGEYELSRGD